MLTAYEFRLGSVAILMSIVMSFLITGINIEHLKDKIDQHNTLPAHWVVDTHGKMLPGAGGSSQFVIELENIGGDWQVKRVEKKQ